MPEKEGAALREGGALPASFFSKENEVRLWPHDIDYSAGPKIAETIADRPGDVPVFFGFPESENAAVVDERTADIVQILDSTMVHVVFLDDADSSGRIEYGHFGSFRSIIDWSRSLIKVLKTRFVGEVNLHQMESVLVVVCRGQQIRITEEECREFAALIGENSNDADVEVLHPFVSCYFLNRELSIDNGAMDIFSSGVWDILIGRLLKAFVLSREQHANGSNSERTLWMRPGIRIWKSEECFLPGAEEAIRRTTEKVLARVDVEAKDAVVSAENGRILAPPCVGCPKNAVEPDPGFDYEGSWSTFDPMLLAHRAEVSERREEAVRKAAKSYFEWRNANTKPDESEIHRVFGTVKEDPRQLFACSKELDCALNGEQGKTSGAEKFRLLVGSMARTEEERKGLVASLAKMAADMKLAQDHYVGLGKGLFVFSAVIAACGVTLWQVITLMGGSLFTVLTLLSACAIGALVTVVSVVATHYHFGYAAAEFFAATCRELDAVASRWHNEAREILCEAVKSNVETHRRNSRLRLHDLLARIRDALVRELQYGSASASAAVARHERALSTFARRQRNDYLERTRQDIGSSASMLRTAGVEDTLLEMWHSGSKSFHDFWRKFCNDHDTRNAGHLPVSAFIPMMRSFMSDFVFTARYLVRQVIDESCMAEKKRGVKAWLAVSGKTLLYSGKAVVNNRGSILRRQVFIAKDKHEEFFNDVRIAGDLTVGSEFYQSLWLTGAEGSPLALAIHEVEIELCSDPETRVLMLRQRASEVES